MSARRILYDSLLDRTARIDRLIRSALEPAVAVTSLPGMGRARARKGPIKCQHRDTKAAHAPIVRCLIAGLDSVGATLKHRRTAAHSNQSYNAK